MNQKNLVKLASILMLSAMLTACGKKSSGGGDDNGSNGDLNNGDDTVFAGDCNESGNVSSEELLLALEISKGEAALDDCMAADINLDGVVSINELITIVNERMERTDSQTD